MAKNDNLDFELHEFNSSSESTLIDSDRDSSSELDSQIKLPNKIQECKEQIHSIAILLTGSIEDAELVVDEVIHEILNNYSEFSKSDTGSDVLNTLIHRLTYDASLKRLLFQVDTCASDLEDMGSQILKSQRFIC